MDTASAQKYLADSNSGKITWDDKGRSEAQNSLSSGSNSSSGASDYQSLARQRMQMQQEANAPAVQSLQSQIPTIQQSYQQQGNYLKSQQAPLEERYKNLLSSIQGQQTQETNRTSTATANELGRRGISSQSGLYEQTVNQALNPINQFYTGQLSNANLDQQAALSSLQNQIAQNPIQQTQAEQQVQQAIAQLQASGNSQGIQQALSLYGQQQQAQQQAAQLALQQQSAASENKYKDAALAFSQQQQPLELQKLQAEIASTNRANQNIEDPNLKALYELVNNQNKAKIPTPQGNMSTPYGPIYPNQSRPALSSFNN